MSSVVESIGLNVKECHVYQIPPRTSNKGYRAADWKLDTPIWTGILRIVSAGPKCFVRLLDKNSAELFAQAEVDAYPGKAVESVTDSSRYFVLRINKGDGSGTYAFIGIGFTDRAVSFDFNVAIKDHFKHEKHVQEDKDAANTPYVAKHATGALTGKIKINIKKKTSDDGDNAKKGTPTISLGASAGLTAPSNLWGSNGPPKTEGVTNPFAPAPTNPFGAPVPTPTTSATNPFGDVSNHASGGNDDWGAFSSDTTSSTTSNNTDWVKF